MAEELSADDRKKLMINYLPNNLDVPAFRALFLQFGPVENAHIVRNSATNESKGYGFITYHDEESSLKAISTLNGHQIGDKRLRVAYSTPVDGSRNKSLNTSASAVSSPGDVNVYIANLPKDWEEEQLTVRFEKYGPVKHCKILKDASGASRGAGFVRYDTSKMAAAAILDMDDKVPEGSTLPLIVKIADGKKKTEHKSGSDFHSGLPGLVLNHSTATANALQSLHTGSHLGYPPGHHVGGSNNGHSFSSAPSHGSHQDSRYNPYSRSASQSGSHNAPLSNAYNHPGAYPPVGSSYSSASLPAPLTPRPGQVGGTVIPGYQPPPHYPPPHMPHSQSPAPHIHPASAVAAPPSAGKNSQYCIYIGNLPETSCKSCLLYQLFSPYGAIVNVKPMSNVKIEAGNDHWFAFVNFKHYADGGAAIAALNGSTLNGRTLKVDFKSEKKR